MHRIDTKVNEDSRGQSVKPHGKRSVYRLWKKEKFSTEIRLLQDKNNVA